MCSSLKEISRGNNQKAVLFKRLKSGKEARAKE
jgi:hypothetical protein